MELGARSLITMGLFVGMLFLGFIYVWKKERWNGSDSDSMAS